MWPFKKKVVSNPEVERKSAAINITQGLADFLRFGQGGAHTPASALELYNESTAVSIPINKIAEAFAGITPVLKNDDKVITQHPLLDLLRNPSPFFDGSLFLEAVAKDYLITNESAIIAIGGINRPPLQLQPISPRNLNITQKDNGLANTMIISGNTLAGSYELEEDAKRARYLNGDLLELKQIRGYSTYDNSLLRGQSLLVSASQEARQHIQGNTHNLSILEKGGRVSLVFHFEEDLDADNFEELKDRVRAQYGGAEKAGEIGVTSGGKMKIEELGINNKDMDFAMLQNLAKNSVALQYKCPLPLISNDAATFNNYKEAKIALWDDAVIPLTMRIFSGLSSFLFPRYGMDPSEWELTYDPLEIPTLRSRILDEIKTRKEINIESDNELRSEVALEPYQGGDVILKPANLIPAGTDIFTGPTQAALPAPTVLREEVEDDV